MKYPLVFVLLAVLMQACTNEQQKSPVPQPERQQSQPAPAQSVPTFDGKKAFECLKAQTNFGPRNPGSTGHQKCLDYLQRELQQYADAVNLQLFTHAGYDGETLKLTNIIGSFNLHSTTRILLIAHWDTRPRADQEKDPKKRNQPILGANDGASGVAICLEIARRLRSAPPAIGIDILFVDGEDYGKEGDTQNYLLGARYFSEHLPKGFSPAFGILLDMVGDKQLEIQKERYSMKYAPDVVDLIWSTAAELGVEQFSSFIQNPVTDDHIPLNEAGIKTIDLIDFNYPDASNRFWHTTEDTPDKCSPESLEAVGKVILDVIYTYKP
ncbi:MAG: M28 family peptidase [Bacteroidota bacterium]